ncbi:MAG: stage II sporulation protein M [Caloramator sp.]|nr:stage II sporulation protein M [Caloramator sp.]
MSTMNNNFFSKHLKENFLLYFFVTLFFAIGLSVGAFMSKALDTNSKQSVLVYINNFFQIVGNENIDAVSIFIRSIKNNGQTLLLIFILCITYIGVPLIFIFDSFKGFILGFTISFCLQTMGFKGLLFLFTAVIPQNIIYIPCLIIASAIAIEHGFWVFKKSVQKNSFLKQRNGLLDIALVFLFLFLIMLIGSLYESFLVPFILKRLSTYLIIQ